MRGVPLLFGGHILPPQVEIGLTDLPKSGGTMAPPAPPETTPPFKEVQWGPKLATYQVTIHNTHTQPKCKYVHYEKANSNWQT